ncbi:MAG: alpha-ketoglutarate-dependent dioxygenase AlkB [Candidatus Protochlamydia sp.]|nr:alpha-ketoglutarate-dependent dioxygenase AlkB [Candidatus Protochlamydia sp.]
MHGQAAKRTVRHFGYSYNYQEVKVAPTDPFPPLISWLAEKCSTVCDMGDEKIASCLISNYPPQSTIGWHTDKFLYGTKVFGISLLSSCQMRFQRTISDKRYVYEVDLEPRSLYILSGQVRYKWQHSIPPVASHRYSITFRSLK